MNASVVANDLERLYDHTRQTPPDEVMPLSLDEIPHASPHMGVYQATMDAPLNQHQCSIIDSLSDRVQPILNFVFVIQNPLIVLLVEQCPQCLGLTNDPCID